MSNKSISRVRRIVGNCLIFLVGVTLLVVSAGSKFLTGSEMSTPSRNILVHLSTYNMTACSSPHGQAGLPPSAKPLSIDTGNSAETTP
jgi:hypothetical protein